MQKITKSFPSVAKAQKFIKAFGKLVTIAEVSDAEVIARSGEFEYQFHGELNHGIIGKAVAMHLYFGHPRYRESMNKSISEMVEGIDFKKVTITAKLIKSVYITITFE